MNDRFARTSALTFSVITQSSAAILLVGLYGSADLGRDWFGQFIVVSIGVIFLSVLHFFEWSQSWTLQIIIARAVLIFIISTPFAVHPELKYLLLASLLIESGLLFPFPKNALLVVSFLLVAIALTRPVKAWGKDFGALSPDSFALFSFVSFLCATLCVFSRIVWDRLLKREADVKRLLITVRQLTDINLSFQEYAILLKDKSVVEERNRISREIHDSMGYTLTNIRMMIEAAIRVRQTDPDKLLEMLVHSRAQAVTGLDDIRYVLRALRSLNTAGKSSLLHMVHQITRAFEDATGVTVAVEYANISEDFSEEAQVVILRLIQEGMTNAFKHGKATRIDVIFRFTDGQLRIILRDNGSGSVDLKEGIGFQGMKERINALNGDVIMRNIPDGFELSAIIPKSEHS